MSIQASVAQPTLQAHWGIDNARYYLYVPYMEHSVTRANWFTAAEEVGLRLESIAVATGKSYSAVYRYRRGDRRPSDAWVAEVAALIEKRRKEWK